MKSITIHNLDEKTAKLIEEQSRMSGLSLNKTIKNVLNQALGLAPEKRNEDFSEFLGLWSEEEFNQFEKNTSEFNRIDESDWIS